MKIFKASNSENSEVAKMAINNLQNVLLKNANIEKLSWDWPWSKNKNQQNEQDNKDTPGGWKAPKEDLKKFWQDKYQTLIDKYNKWSQILKYNAHFAAQFARLISRLEQINKFTEEEFNTTVVADDSIQEIESYSKYLMDWANFIDNKKKNVKLGPKKAPLGDIYNQPTYFDFQD